MISDETHSPPSSSLPKLGSFQNITDAQLSTALDRLRVVYCPLRIPAGPTALKVTSNAVADSGYASEDDNFGDCQSDHASTLAALRIDEFERNYAITWLTRLISRADSLPFDEAKVSEIVDAAGAILASFSESGADNEEEPLCREFSFLANLPSGNTNSVVISLNDAPLSSSDHTDVGLQSWGASIIFSDLICASPERFGLTQLPPSATLIELGAGTGLISLTLAKLLPLLPVPTSTIMATDYHTAVLDNLRANVAMNLSSKIEVDCGVQVAPLDWATPPESLKSSVDMLFAADVVYAAEHAVWLRDCAARLLTSDGSFWLMATIRNNGKFEGIANTVQTAFSVDAHCPTRDGQRLAILEMELLDKKKSIGRGDESGYMLFKIGWSSI